ncbi:MAG: DUF4129 domain-containing protein, partial [Ktedonobacteraceae bacterium]|nr:DUF4129 domain-containing protein [Ktedonobacteraceae bacterium]
REIYRALLKLVAGYGYSRRKSETPHEFQRRLVNDRMPQVEPSLGVVTEAYTAVRYGTYIPNEAELARVHQAWQDVQQRATQQPGSTLDHTS